MVAQLPGTLRVLGQQGYPLKKYKLLHQEKIEIRAFKTNFKSLKLH